MKTLKERFKDARKKAQLTQEELSNISGIPQQKISRIENGITEMPRDIGILAKYLNTTPGYLMFGESSDGLTISQHIIPLLSWEHIPQWCCSKGHTQLTHINVEKIACFKSVNKKSFAVKVEGDSMLSMDGMSFSAGTMLIIDPEKPVKSDDYVIATVNKNEATFKQLIIDGGKKYLKPLNSRYPIVEMTRDMNICGVVVATQHEL